MPRRSQTFPVFLAAYFLSYLFGSALDRWGSRYVAPALMPAAAPAFTAPRIPGRSRA